MHPQEVTGDAVGSIQARTRRFFMPAGRFEQACRDETFAYEPRPQQAQMADAIAAALTDRAHVTVEAGTGVGKSFAYLVPMILQATDEAANGPAVISTYTISLQEQLIDKDIPFLRRHLGLEFDAVLVKGRGNYLCRRRLARAQQKGGDLLAPTREQDLSAIRRWSLHTRDGSLSDMPHQPARSSWQQVCAEHGNCMGRRCEFFKRCFFMRARNRIHDAHVLVLNHHLFFSELALRLQGAAFLPAPGALVFDEAHVLEDVASEHLGLRLSPYMFEHWLRRMQDRKSGKGLLRMLGDLEAQRAVELAWQELDNFFAAVADWADFERHGAQRVVREPLALESELADRLETIVLELGKLRQAVQDADVRTELGAVRRRGMELGRALKEYLGQKLEDHVYWIEREGARRQPVLYSAPVEVGPLLAQHLFDGQTPVVMTSATLAVGGKLAYFQNRVGAQNSRGLCVGSPFDFQRQMRLLIARDMPNPNDKDLFAPRCADAIAHFVEMTQGAAFVLFTNAALMRTVAGMLVPAFSERGLTCFVQGTGTPRHVMLQQFRADTASVLFGLDSFWMGVDVRGEALSNVIITRLPFAVPSHPVVSARAERIRDTGGEPFRDYALPEAILKFRQGFGRLIRASTDQGIVAVLDNRIQKRWYGRAFIQSLPACPVESVLIPYKYAQRDTTPPDRETG